MSPSIPGGQSTAQVNGATVSYLTTPPDVSIGDVTAKVAAAALNPSALGLYQIAVTIPDAAPSGDQAIVATAGGQSSPVSGVYLTVQ